MDGLNNQGTVNSETRIEGLILDYVKQPTNLFGKIDFLSRQYPASPAKPSNILIKWIYLDIDILTVLKMKE